MSLTKKDKEEITEIVKRIIGESQTHNGGDDLGEQGNRTYDILSQINDWNEDAIDTGMGFVVAPDDVKIDGNEYFTWDEAKEIEEKYLIPNGWRLPTVAEFVMLYGKFGIDEKGNDDPDKFLESLRMEKKGYKSGDYLSGLGNNGLWWSASPYTSATYAYNLVVGSSGLIPQNNSDKAGGFALRCVRDKSPAKGTKEARDEQV